ncbi:MAG TPA: ParB/RepB/Spo0J family partition protein, partial [Clostridia bacterium]|nr:ParB/RepB/Spo0J family partition protein [Clostridia bacterium]
KNKFFLRGTNMKKTGQGLSIDALFNDYASDITTFDSNGVLNKGVEELDIDIVIPNPEQPRKNFDEEQLNNLANSIKNVGLIQPITVVKKGSKYIIIAGERRYRASIIAGMKKIPVIVKDYTERECKEIALIENLQRSDLNPIEEAVAFSNLINEYNLSQEELANTLSKSRSAIANSLRILTLPPEVKQLVIDGKLSAGHAKALVSLNDVGAQIKYANAAANKQLSVRTLEMMVKAYNNNEETPKKPIKLTSELKEFVNDMQRIFATKVKIIGNEEKGRIYLDYYTKDDLQRIYELIDSLKK